MVDDVGVARDLALAKSDAHDANVLSTTCICDTKLVLRDGSTLCDQHLQYIMEI